MFPYPLCWRQVHTIVKSKCPSVLSQISRKSSSLNWGSVVFSNIRGLHNIVLLDQMRELLKTWHLSIIVFLGQKSFQLNHPNTWWSWRWRKCSYVQKLGPIHTRNNMRHSQNHRNIDTNTWIWPKIAIIL